MSYQSNISHITPCRLSLFVNVLMLAYLYIYYLKQTQSLLYLFIASIVFIITIPLQFYPIIYLLFFSVTFNISQLLFHPLLFFHIIPFVHPLTHQFRIAIHTIHLNIKLILLYQIMIFIFLLISVAQSLSLTTGQCPASFNILSANITSQSSFQINKYATSLYKSYITNQQALKIQNIIIKSDTNDLFNYIMQLSVPFIVVAVFVFIMYCILISCCLFDRSCPPCQTWRRDTFKRPYEKKQITVGTWFFFSFSIFIVIICMVIFSTITNVKTSISNTKCGIYTTIDTTINGGISNNWGGFLNISYQIGNISSQLNSTNSTFSIYFGNNQFLVDNITSMQTFNSDLYQKYIVKNSSLISPDPTTPMNTIVSNFILNQLGPANISGTMLSDISGSLSKTADLTTSAYDLDQAAMIVQDSIPVIINNTVLSKILFSIYTSQLNQTISMVSEFSDQYFDSYFEWGIYLLQCIVGFGLIGAMLGILGGFSAFCFDVHSCRLIIHFSWLVFGLIYTGVIFLCFIFIPAGSMGTQFCTFFNQILNNKTVYRQFGNYNPQNVLVQLENCFFSDGNILNTFSAESQMDTLFTFFNSYQTYTSTTNSTNRNYVDLNIAYNTINNWKIAMQNYRDGIYIDTNTSLNSDANPLYALKTLNDYSNNSVNGLKCTKDQWVYDSTNCTSNKIYSQGSDPSTGLTIDNTTNWCYSFNSRLSTGSDLWTQADFTQRYIQIKQSCYGSYLQIIAYGQQLIKYRDSRINLFKSMIDDLSLLLANNVYYNGNLSNFKIKVENFMNAISTLNTLVNDQYTGLKATNNCTIIASDTRFVYNSFCINFMSEVIKIAICLIGLSLCLIGGLISGNIIAIRYTKMAKQEQLIGEMSSGNLQVKEKQYSDDSFDEE